LAPLITGLLISSTGSFVAPLLFTAAVGLLFGCGGFGLVVKNLDQEIGEADYEVGRPVAEFNDVSPGLSRA
jgi:hypothetical protein